MTITTYIASHGSSTPVVFINTLPPITATTFLLIYVEVGSDPVRGYAQHILIFTPSLDLLRGHGILGGEEVLGL